MQDAQIASNPPAHPPGTRPAVATARVDDEWRRWIAENLYLGMTPESMLSAMVARGISAEEGGREIALAQASPYFVGSKRLRSRLDKRDWILAAYRKLNRLLPRSAVVERRHKISRGEFLAENYSANRPVIITGMMDDWPALKKWNLDFFAQQFGDREIELQVGRTAGDNYEIEREKFIQKIRMSDFVDKIRTSGPTNDYYLTANNNSSNKRILPELWDDIVPIREYLSDRDPQAGFFWMGPPGTITPFHHDLTNNFMAQVVGSKRVKIAPSWDIPLMRNHFHVYSEIDGRRVPADPTPAADAPQILECTLGAGEILFLPIGCMHFVEGLEFSITVSFTNFVFDNEFTSFYRTYHGV